MNLNYLTIAGNLTRDPELRFTPKQTAVASLSVAVNEKRTVNGETKESVTFVDCTAFGKTAEAICNYLKKGRGIFIQGRLRLETWTDKTTNKPRSKLGVVVDNFQFTDKSPSATSSGIDDSDMPPTAPRAMPAPASASVLPKDDGDEVPF